MGLRLIILFSAIALLAWLARRLLKRKAPPTTGPAPARQMLRCDHCGLHIPSDEALSGPDGNYCCAAHRAAGRTPPA